MVQRGDRVSARVFFLGVAVLSLALLVVAGHAGAQLTENSAWSLTVTVTGPGGVTDTATFGVNATATGGFDASFDTTEPSLGAAPDIQLYFAYPTNSPAQQNLTTSIHAIQNVNHWNLSIIHSTNGGNALVNWTATQVNDRIHNNWTVELNQTGTHTNFRQASNATVVLASGSGVPQVVLLDLGVFKSGQAPQCGDGFDNDGDSLIDTADPNCFNAQDPSEFSDPQCSDGFDNDGDGKTDYNVTNPSASDPDCVSFSDNSEAPTTGPVQPQCSDGLDNDGDQKIDFNVTAGIGDPDCVNAQDNSEFPAPQCSDGIDNDGDTFIDFNATGSGDPDCTDSFDPFESASGGTSLPQCRDGVDNDFDGRTDLNASDNFLDDPDCTTPDDPSEFPNSQCSDGIDNDGDGTRDRNASDAFTDDTDCVDEFDNSESSTTGPETPQCSDGIDNDGDGKIDFNLTAPSLSDPDCTDQYDFSEVNFGGGGGSEICGNGMDDDGDGQFDEPDCGFAGGGGGFGGNFSSGPSSFLNVVATTGDFDANTTGVVNDVRVRVTNATGVVQPNLGVEISRQSCFGFQFVANGLTDGTGNKTFFNLTAGAFDVGARNSTTFTEGHTSFRFGTGNQTLNALIRDNSGNPVTNTDVLLFSAGGCGSGTGGGGDGVQDQPECFTNATGECSLTNFTVGSYNYEIEHFGSHVGTERGFITFPLAASVNFTGGRIIFNMTGTPNLYTLHATMVQGATIRVNVTSPNGTRLGQSSGISVNAFVSSFGSGGFGGDSFRFCQDNFTAPGNFTCSGLSTGNWSIRVDTFGSPYVPLTVGPIAAVQGNTTFVSAQLSEGGRVRGRVLNSAGQGIPSASVNVFQEFTGGTGGGDAGFGGFSGGFAFTNGYGEYLIDGLTNGTHRIEVMPPFNRTDLARNSSTFVAIVGTTVFKNVTMTAGGSISGQVQFPNGTPLNCPSTAFGVGGFGGPGGGGGSTPNCAFINAFIPFGTTGGGGEGGFGYAQTNETGNFTVGGLGTGCYEVFIEPFSGLPYGRVQFAGSSCVNVIRGNTTLINNTGIAGVNRLTAGGLITGRVTRADTGAPVTFAGVGGFRESAIGPGGEGHGPGEGSFTFTDATGNYSIGGLSNGTYFVFVNPQSFGPGGTTDLRSDTRSGIVVSAGTTTFVNFTLGSGGKVKGKVLKSDGSAFANGGANAFSLDALSFGFGNLDGSGNFEISGLSPGCNYNLEVFSFFGGERAIFNNLFCVTSGNTTNVGELRAAAPATLRGFVKKADGTVVSSAFVNAFSEQHFGGGFGSTDGSGEYILRNMPVGTYNMRVDPPFGSGLTGQSASGIVVTDGATTFKNFTMGAGGCVNGTAVNSSGGGIAFAWVHVFNPAAHFGSGGVTNATGFFEVCGISAGTGYLIEVNPPPGSALSSCTRTGVQVNESATTTLGNCAMGAGGVFLGRLVGADGAPVRFVGIDAQGTGGNFCWGRTGFDGRFRIVGCQAPDNYTLRIFPDHGSSVPPQTLPGTRQLNESESKDLGDITITSAAFTLTGRVLDNFGGAVENANVEVFSTGGFGGGSFATDSRGRFNATGLLNGTYNVIARGPHGSAFAQNNTNATVSGDTDMGVIVLGAPGGTITFNVTNATGAAISGADVSVFNSTLMVGLHAETVANGTAVLVGLPPGTFRTEVRAAGFVGNYSSLVLGSSSVTVSVVLQAFDNSNAIRGNVTNAASVANLTVLANGTLPDGTFLVEFTVTNSTGFFELLTLHPNVTQWNVTVFVTGTTTATVTGVLPGDLGVDVDAAVASRARVAGDAS